MRTITKVLLSTFLICISINLQYIFPKVTSCSSISSIQDIIAQEYQKRQKTINYQKIFIIYNVDTLLRPVGTLGCPSWLNETLARIQTFLLNQSYQETPSQEAIHNQAIEQTTVAYKKILPLLSFCPVEQATVAAIQTQKQAGFKIIGLKTNVFTCAGNQETAYCDPAEVAVIKMLENFNMKIDFPLGEFNPKHTFAHAPAVNGYRTPLDNNHDVVKNGILFIHPLSTKANAIKTLAQQLLKTHTRSNSPELIVLVDDNAQDLQEVDTTCKDINQQFLGIHYTPQLPEYNSTQAQREFCDLIRKNQALFTQAELASLFYPLPGENHFAPIQPNTKWQ